jgi:biopolymer transport protein ExbD
MRCAPIILLLAALPGCKKGAEAPAELAPLTLPVASSGQPDKGEYPHDRVIISVDAKGFVSCNGKRATLDELGAILSDLTEKYDLKRRAKGKSGFESLLEGGASKLYVLLRADKETPWQHVRWLMTILSEHKLYKLQIAVSRVADRSYTKEEAARLGAEWVDRPPSEKARLEAELDAFLSKVDWVPVREPSNDIKAGVHIVARKEVAAKWGPDGVPVSKPTAFRYRLSDRTVDKLEHVGQWIWKAKQAVQGLADCKVIGEIRAGHKVPLKQVVAVLNEFHALGVKQIEFWPTLAVEDERTWNSVIPGQEVRERPYLPYPLKNYPTGR